MFLLQDQSAPTNRALYASDKRPIPAQAKLKTTQKFEGKMLLCIAKSEKQKQAASQTTYLNQCIIARLIPLIKSDDNKEKVLTSLRVIMVTMFYSISMKMTYKEFNRQAKICAQY